MQKLQTILFIFFITTSVFAQKPSTKMIATILGKFEGNVSKQELIDKGKIEIVSKHKCDYKIIGFEYIGIAKGGILYSAESNSDSLTSEIKESILLIGNGKRIYLHKIKATNRKDTAVLNSIRLKISDTTDSEPTDFSYNKATFANLIDGKLDTSEIRKISKLELLQKNQKSKIVHFELFGSHGFDDLIQSTNAELTAQMKANIKHVSSNRFICFYNIQILENNKIKQIPPIFIQVGDKIGYGK